MVVTPPAAEVAEVAKLPILLTLLVVEVVPVLVVAAGLVVPVAADEPADDPPPEPAWIVQISAVMLWTSVKLVRMHITIEGLQRTQSIRDSAFRYNTWSSGRGDRALRRPALASIVTHSTPSSGDSSCQASERTRW